MVDNRPRVRLRFCWFASIGVGVALLTSAVCGQARAAGPPSTTDAQPGMIAAAPPAGQINQALQRRTGYSTSQVTTESVCPKPAGPGQPQCAAQVVVTRSGHQIVHLPAGSRQRPEQIRSPVAAAISSPVPATAQAPPSPWTPGYLQQAYDLSWLSANRGSGDTVAIVDTGYDADAASDLAAFRSQNGLSSCPPTGADPCFTQVNEYGSTDVAQMPATLATTDPWHLETTLDIDAVSSICPDCNILLVESVGNDQDFDIAEQTAANLGAGQISNSFVEGVGGLDPPLDETFPGVLTVASAGDAGYTGSSVDNYPAAGTDVVAAGGTTLGSSGVSAGRGFGESAWNQSGLYLNPDATGSGCDIYEPKPTWQTDVGCAGRAYNDISADADPLTGLEIDNAGQWELVGGTSLSSPLIAAYAALIGEHTNSPAWTYADAADLFDPSTGNDEDGVICTPTLSYICDAGVGYDGPTGNGSISGTVVAGAPGIGGGAGVASVSDRSASVLGGVFSNGLPTSYYWQYGPTTGYGSVICATADSIVGCNAATIGSGHGVVGISDTLPGLTPTSSYHYRLVATNSDGTVYGYDAVLSTLAGGVVDVPAGGTPAISGAAVLGQTLSASAGLWHPAPGSFTYQWQRSADDSTFTDIAGQTGPSYEVSGADVGDFLQVQVTAIDTAGQGIPAVSAPTAQVTTLVPGSTGPPVLNTATAVNGQTLTVASIGAWNPAANEGYAYQWQRSADGNTWTDISSATAATYTAQGADVANDVRVQVTAFDSHGAGQPASSAATLILTFPQSLSPPTVAGTAKRLDTLTASDGQWAFRPTLYAYQWQVSVNAGISWGNIAGATGPSFTLATNDQETDELRVQVTATNAVGQTTANSASTEPVADNPPYAPTTPTVQGTPAVNSQLTIANGTFGPSPDPSMIPETYQWQRSTDGNAWTDIAGQTVASYTPTDGDIGDQLRVKLADTNADGETDVFTSAVTVAAPPVVSPTITAPAVTATTPLGLQPPVALEAPTLSGAPTVGQTLIAVAATWANGPTFAAVQIMRCTSAATGCAAAAGASYTLTGADVGDYFYALATAANAAGTSTQRQAAANDGPVIAQATTPSAAQTATAEIARTGTKAVKTATGTRYATAKLAAMRHVKKRQLTVTRAAGITVPMTMWACQSAGKRTCVPKKTSARASWTTALTGALTISARLS